MTRAIAYVGLGSNLAHPRRQLARALAHLAKLPRTRIVAVSRNFVSAPIGAAEQQPDYVNAVALLSTSLSPRALLARFLAIERRHGRRRRAGMRPNAPRPLDLDLLLYGRVRMRVPSLVLPHPRMHERAFVLRPLIDVAPTTTIPGVGLARRLVRNVRSQRITPTRAHAIH
ncbi:MAG TPA: 2-amino-4-hydroxy-6-hydroxymethyldihydropteridine diphosphokinase [Casimicrobiaceae bacterium]